MYFGFKPYVPVAQRHARARAHAAKLAKKEKREPAPIKLSSRAIASSFWGKAWCDHLEAFSDYENRLPRGRTYVRNGSVVDLRIESGKVKAIVAGSEVYRVNIDIKTLPAPAWSRIKKDCTRSIDSLIDLLQGRFDEGVMRRLTCPQEGLFPKPAEIKMSCSCPDWAGMCKHVAAVLYGVGARLDVAPELLFLLRNVDHLELISQAVAADNLAETLDSGAATNLANSDLGAIFGIDLAVKDVPREETAPVRRAGRPKMSEAGTKAGTKAVSKKSGAAKAGATARLKKAPKARRKTAVRS